MFYVGQKVVCIDNHDYVIKCPLILNNVYIIDSIEEICGIDTLFLRFKEIDGAWFSTRFRPVIERKTDISIFIAMLNKDKERV